MSDPQVIERVWKAPMELVWELWTTPEGLGSWWGPRGFQVTVEEMDLRVGGSLCYVMKATSPEMIAMMEQRGQPVVRKVQATYTLVEPRRRLAYDSPFGPETMSTSVEFSIVPEGVRMVLVLDASKPGMTGGAAMGWRSALGRLEERLLAVG
jgi:uncharacterized protein YndB with AHSA1/START domain